MSWPNNDYFYYGQAVKLNHRFGCHKETMKKGKHKNRKVQSIFNKYGLPNFEVIEYCEIENLNEREQFYIDANYGKRGCCNLLPLATSARGYKHSDETKEKNRLSKIGVFDGEKNPFYGRKHTEETKAKISKMRTGKKYPKLSESLKGRRATEETKILLSESHKYGRAWKAKKVIDTETGQIFSCVKEVSDLNNIPASTLRSKLNGSKKNDTKWEHLKNGTNWLEQ